MKEKSFTLIELLVVIAIIGLLSSVVLVSMQGVRGKARIAKGLDFSKSVQHVLGAYAVGWWSFETIEAGNQVIDGSGYNNHGTLVNGATIAPGLQQLGNALSFDGMNDYVDVGNGTSLNFTTQDFTIELWAYFNNLNDILTFFSKGSWTVSGYFFDMRSSGLLFFATSQSGAAQNTQTTNVVVSAGTWTHIVVVRTGANAYFYVNGENKPASTGTHINPTAPTGYTGKIGAYGAATANFFRGLIDEVRIYERALTMGEIQKHYVEGLEKHKNLTIK